MSLSSNEYVGDIFSRQFAVIDHIERLPEWLPRLFMGFTRQAGLGG